MLTGLRHWNATTSVCGGSSARTSAAVLQGKTLRVAGIEKLLPEAATSREVLYTQLQAFAAIISAFTQPGTAAAGVAVLLCSSY